MNLKLILLTLLTLSGFSACHKVPITGRRQLSLVSEKEMQAMSFKEYSSFLSQSRIVRYTPDAEMVKRVGQKISAAVTEYLHSKGQEKLLDGYAWEFNLVDDRQVNAWCMPGGKVVVYTGIMPIVKDENGLAVVMGHEIAHAIARHGNERMSQGLVQQLGGIALAVAVSDKPSETQQIFMGAYGIGTTVGLMLPFSRTHESEADILGIDFMAMAGYDPNHAVTFWQRMADASKGQAKPDEFLSTHPSDATRIANIKKHLPDALRYYKN
ncbi:MAG: M48 family metallopeptidase [Bacteroidia bacterium]|nr:M48 family metallopeptidase [Bacteroidia bacterium]